jgi:ATP-dependent Clp protease ATP-binding subunit ClpA
MASEDRSQIMEMARMGRCAKLAWEHAVEARETNRIPRAGVMTGHVLLGVLKEPSCAGGIILAKMGLDLNVAILHTEFVLLHGRRRDTPEQPTVDWEGVPHTPQAKLVLDHSLEEANLFYPTYPIGTEHLLLGLLRDPDGFGGRLLRFLGIELDAARATRDAFWQILKLGE